MTIEQQFGAAMAQLPLVAILRGIGPAEAPAVGDALVASGWRLLEVPLNSPEPLRSIELLAARCSDALVGAGTVLEASQVGEIHRAGARLVIAPNFNPEVAAEARRLGMAYVPGVLTPSEAFAALAAGAAALKLFPAEMISPAAVKAMRAVIPASVMLLPVGGIHPGNMASYRAAGASGFGIGSALFKPGTTAEEVKAAALRFKSAWEQSLSG